MLPTQGHICVSPAQSRSRGQCRGSARCSGAVRRHPRADKHGHLATAVVAAIGVDLRRRTRGLRVRCSAIRSVLSIPCDTASCTAAAVSVPADVRQCRPVPGQTSKHRANTVIVMGLAPTAAPLAGSSSYRSGWYNQPGIYQVRRTLAPVPGTAARARARPLTLRPHQAKTTKAGPEAEKQSQKHYPHPPCRIRIRPVLHP
jgi:hypothetical protein